MTLHQVKEWGFLLLHESERKNNAQDALLFNGLVSAWKISATRRDVCSRMVHKQYKKRLTSRNRNMTCRIAE